MKLPELAPQDGDAKSTATPLIQAENSFFNEVDASGTVMPKQKRSLRWLWILLGVLGGLILAVYIGFAIYFMSHFTFNTTINGVNVAFQSADEVDTYIASEISNYTLQIEARENQNATVNGSEIGLRYVADGQIADKLESQQAWAWPLSLFPDNASNIQHVNVEFDEQKLNTVLGTMAILDEEQMRKPVDAKLVFEGNAYVIAEADEGTTLDAQKIQAAIAEAIDHGETTLHLDEGGFYVRPAVPSDDPALVTDRDRFNQYVPFQIIYTLGDRREVLDGYTTINWVDTSGEGPYTLNQDAVSAWVADFASRYDTLGSTRAIVNGFGEEKTVTGGTYGWQVDQDAEFWAIIHASEQHLGEERAPYMLGTAASLGAQDWGTTYLEVDTTQQHMWYFVDGVCVFETDIVSGNPNTNGTTPEGVYHVFSKSMNVTLRGPKQPDGSYEWESPVEYWMPFTYSGCGFHDANWQSSFGGTAYLWRGSHGCINMPWSKAGELYSMVEAGTPVIIHY